MNVERLYTVAEKILDDFDNGALLQLMQNLINNLQNSINSPSEPSYQVAVRESKEALLVALRASEVNNFPPTWLQAISELGISHLLGIELAEKIDGLFLANAVTPAAIKVDIDVLAQSVKELDATLRSLVDSLDELLIEGERLAPGECEVSVLIPRTAIDNGLKELGEELIEFQKILAPFSELVTGSRPIYEVNSISSSDFGIFIPLDLATSAVLAVAVQQVLALYQTLLEYKAISKSLKTKKAPPAVLNPIKTHAASIMQKGIEDLVDQLLKENAQGAAGRTNELRAELIARLNALANRVDKGYNIDVAVEPINDENGGSSDRTKAQINTILSASPHLKFLNTGGEPMLALPEAIDIQVPKPKRATKPKKESPQTS